MSSLSIALGLPHTPWVPVRVGSFCRLLKQLEIGENKPLVARVFDERASNKVWPSKMWRWALETGASHFLTLQDDVLVCENFWAALRAILAAYPDRILGLSATHPIAPELAYQGARWYRTRSWLIGWAYLIPRADLETFVAWVDQHPHELATRDEDALLNEWIFTTQRDTWHPIPSLVDHDTSLESTYGNDHHTHRRTTVTWHKYDQKRMEDPAFWRDGSTKLLPTQWERKCWACLARACVVESRLNGCGLCAQCLCQFVVEATGEPFSLTVGPEKDPAKRSPPAVITARAPLAPIATHFGAKGSGSSIGKAR